MNSILKVKDKNGKWIDIPGIVGPQGPAGESGGIKTYAELPDKPTINGIEIEGIHDLWHYGIQSELKPGVNIKNINGQSLIGSGNIEIEGGSGGITEIPIASKDTLGGIKVGANLSITEDGTLNAIGGGSEEGAGYDDVPIYTIVDYEGEEIPDGWVEVEEIHKRNMASLTIASDYTVTNTKWGTIPLDAITIIGDKLSLQDYGIKIGAGVTTIRVSAGFYLMASSTEGDRHFNIWKNNDKTKLNATVTYSHANKHSKLTTGEALATVNEGDIILLGVSLQANDQLGAGATTLFVEVVE